MNSIVRPVVEPGSKIVGVAAASSAARGLPGPRVFTNGVFDLLHRGHCAMLAAARAAGGSLIVGVNSDASARRLGKGAERPIHAEVDRAFVLACLEAVDLVVVFEEDTPCELLERLRPEIYVKGADYDVASMAETRLIESWGGRSLALPLVGGHSTTRIVRRLRATQATEEVPA